MTAWAASPTRPSRRPGQPAPRCAARRGSRGAPQPLHGGSGRDLGEKLRAKIGTVEEVIIDEYDDEAGLAIGRTKADSPEIDGKCYVETLTPYKPGDFVKVRITGSEEYDLVGTPEDEVQTS